MKIVTAAIIRLSNRVMVFRRASGQQLEGAWEFPGGKLEENETLENCLKRELMEELGIKADIGCEIGRTKYKYSHGEIELVAFEVINYSGDIRLSVHDMFDWVEINTLTEIDLAPADIGLIDYLKES